mmetsp:Transcript_99178/g.258567  ORF Transcript_99178/g.258567 Transcript_99178/m.258567 type:complete len:260 (+) Transcript_99178:531-1310(+)
MWARFQPAASCRRDAPSMTRCGTRARSADHHRHQEAACPAAAQQRTARRRWIPHSSQMCHSARSRGPSERTRPAPAGARRTRGARTPRCGRPPRTARPPCCGAPATGTARAACRCPPCRRAPAAGPAPGPPRAALRSAPDWWPAARGRRAGPCQPCGPRCAAGAGRQGRSHPARPRSTWTPRAAPAPPRSAASPGCLAGSLPRWPSRGPRPRRPRPRPARAACPWSRGAYPAGSSPRRRSRRRRPGSPRLRPAASRTAR